MQQNTPQNDITVEGQKLLFEQIESLVKEFHMHRCALDFDRGFLSLLLSIKEEIT